LFNPPLKKGDIGGFALDRFRKIRPTPEGVKKLVCVLLLSFQRKPEASLFKPLRNSWAPVYTGVTTKKQFFHSFPLQKGEYYLPTSSTLFSESRLGL
jgi:hypothetical protein